MQTLNIEEYVPELIERLKLGFGDRLVYVGLHGSFRRGEADESSDIDLLVTLDTLAPADLDRYREIIEAMPFTERSCGFISGREELKNWPPYEICQLLHETRDFHGELRPLLPDFSRDDLRNYVRLSVANLYHALCHSRIHAEPEPRLEMLKGLYKAVFYILQNSRYLATGEWIMTKAALLETLQGLDREVLSTAMALKSGLEQDSLTAGDTLFAWCQQHLREP